MATLKSVMAIATLIISLNANANDIKTLQKQLKPWQPLEITNKNNSLTVVLPGKEISPDAWCMRTSLDKRHACFISQKNQRNKHS